jgi:hypothetical protein
MENNFAIHGVEKNLVRGIKCRILVFSKAPDAVKKPGEENKK